jgi:hypothetical protein
MKLLPILLMNVALVGGGIVIYDQMREDAPATTYAAGGIDHVDVAGLSERIAALEGRAPGLRATGIDAGLLARLETLESKLAVRAPADSGGDVDDTPSAPGTDGDMAMPKLDDGVEPSTDEVRRFRKMMEAAEQLRRDERERDRLLAQLKELEVTLNPKQTDQLISATRDYRSKIGDVWRKSFSGARDAGADREAMREQARQGMETLKEEFAVTINKFIPAGDAQKIVENMGRVGGRGFGAMSAPGRRGGR